MATELDEKVAKKFFGALYADENVAHSDRFDPLVTRLVAELDGHVSAGDQALQTLMFRYVLSSPRTVSKAKSIVVEMGNIKQAAVKAFVETFPATNLEDLIASAEAAGFDVQVLGA